MTLKIRLPVVPTQEPPPKLSFVDKVRSTSTVRLDDGAPALATTATALPGTPSETWEAADLQCLQKEPPSIIQTIQGVLDRRRKDPSFFRPSGFGGCRRSQVFGYNKEYQEPPQPDDTLSMILETGTALHAMVQQWLSEHPGVFFAKEVPVWLPELEIKGSSDGILMFRRADKYGSIYRWGFELKTIGPKGFEDLRGPKPEHVVQASIYAKLMGVWWITIVYYCKGTSKLKEYHVSFDPQVWESVKQRVAELKVHTDGGTLPEYDTKECKNSINLCRYVRRCHELEGKKLPVGWGGR